VTEVGGKHGELPLDIDPLAIPAEERTDGEAMPQVVDARPSVITRASQADLAGQAPENTMNILVQQSAAPLGHKELRAAARPKVSITPFGVAEESFMGRLMQGHEARLGELTLSNRQHALAEVDVAALKADRLGQTHSCHRNQPEQIMVGPSPQSGCRRQGQRRRQQSIDLRIAVNIGLGALQARQYPGRRDLCLRIDVRAKPRTSVNRNVQDACRSGGNVAQATASFVVIVVALRFSMKVTKSASRRA